MIACIMLSQTFLTGALVGLIPVKKVSKPLLRWSVIMPMFLDMEVEVDWGIPSRKTIQLWPNCKTCFFWIIIIILYYKVGLYYIYHCKPIYNCLTATTAGLNAKSWIIHDDWMITWMIWATPMTKRTPPNESVFYGWFQWRNSLEMPRIQPRESAAECWMMWVWWHMGWHHGPKQLDMFEDILSI